MNSTKRQFLFFLVLFFVVNLLQAAFTGLLEDEAYYWVWSNNLAWGYFDHPPMVALFIWLGSSFFDGELGVRVLSAISFTLMLWFMWKTVEDKEKENHVTLFFVLIVSIALIQVYGFISTPDTALVLFTAVFFYSYKCFLDKQGWRSILFLGFSMAGLLYSKYHGILIIGFTVLSNIKLLRNSRFWAAGVFGFALFLPHLIWQYKNGFPTFLYHLTQRSKPYEFNLTLTHLINIVAVVGITFPIIYASFLRKKAESTLQKSFKFNVFGFILFFFITSFRSTSQAQWLAAMLVPLCVFVFPYFMKNKSGRLWLYRLGLLQLVLILLARVFLSFSSLSPVELENHYANNWVPEVKRKTNGSPIVFINSYQNASIYKFYTGIDTHSYGTPRGRKSQYDLLDTEAIMNGQSVYVVGKQLRGLTFLTRKGSDDLYGKPVNPFLGLQNFKCVLEMDSLEMFPGKHMNVPTTFVNPYNTELSFKDIRIIGVFQNRKKEVQYEFEIPLKELEKLNSFEIKKMLLEFDVPKEIDQNWTYFRLGASYNNLPTGLQGNKVLVNFEVSQ